MDALLQFSYPTGVVIVGTSAIVVALIGLMVLGNRYAPQIATPVVIISLLMTLTFLIVVVYSTLRPLPESKTGELLLGALISTFTTVVVYWFGKGGGRPPEG